jgi:hypothetical protein
MSKTPIQSVIDQLQKERARLQDELHRVSAALTVFGKIYQGGSNSGPTTARRKRTISAAGRRRIAAAQKARWAKFRGSQKKK